MFTRILRWAGAIALVPIALIFMEATALALPQPFFPYEVSEGRLELYSDRPFDRANAEALLAEVDARLARSPLDEGNVHRIFVSNVEWRRRVFMNYASGAAGVNFYPVTRNVFIRQADIDGDAVIGPSGKPAEPPRTFAYYAAHEITHTLTGEHLGAWKLWNKALPQWIREGYADYVGMGGATYVDPVAMYASYRAHDARFNPASGYYARFRMLVAYFLDERGWSVDRLLASGMSLDAAQAEMDAAMALL